MIYIATPYTHDDKRIEQLRFDLVTLVAARLIAKGLHIYSPITHCHPIAQAFDTGTDWETWRDMDLYMLGVCAELWVLKIDGWEHSEGVRCEIAAAKHCGIELRVMTPSEMIEAANEAK